MTRSPASAARLEAAAAAKRLHRDFDIERRVTDSGGVVDVFATISELGIPLLFKPLESALGLCLPKPTPGILVTTRRTLNIQRFTAAHELGHAVLGHKGSIDKEIFERGPSSPDGGRDLNEVAADAFAAEFLLPRWLYRLHVQRQGWSVLDLTKPDIVYQLSLRLGASYEATCWGMLSHQILTRTAIDRLRSVEVAAIKTLLGERFRPGDPWADVWRVTERDNGGTLSGTGQELVRVELIEHASGGYEWDTDALRAAGLEVLEDRSDFPRGNLRYGGPSIRNIIARPAGPMRTRLALVERQPWEEARVEAQLALTLAFDVSEKGGLSRADRQRLGVVPP